jgi:hypothetical protein
MLARFATAVVLSVAAEQAFAVSSEQIVGSWKSDDRRAYSEVHFRADHSFTLFSRMSMRNPALAVGQMAEQFGTWRIESHRLKLDSTDRTWNKQSQISIAFTATKRRLRMQSVYDRTRTDTYTRMNLPSCAEGAAAASHPFDQRALVGRWRGHFRTHDTEFSFETGRRVTIYGWDLGDRMKFEDATWHFSRDVITIKPRKESLMSDSQIRWRIIRTGDSCLVVSDGSSMSYTLRRVE